MRILRLSLFTCAAIIMLAAGATAAELTGKIGVTPQVGVVMPIQALQGDDAGGSAKMGFAGGITGEYFINDNIAIGGRFVFDRFSLDVEDPMSGNWTMMEMGVFGKYLFLPGTPTRPFVRGGVLMGKAKLKVEYGEGTMDSEADYSLSPGAELAGGVVHEVKENISIYGEIGWTVLATDGADVDVTQNGVTRTGESQIHLQWVGVKAGATFFFGKK